MWCKKRYRNETDKEFSARNTRLEEFLSVHFTYLLFCENGIYYTGYTKDVRSRFMQHKRGVEAKYTRLHKPIRLVHAEELETNEEAMRREIEIKKLSHKEKKD